MLRASALACSPRGSPWITVGGPERRVMSETEKPLLTARGALLDRNDIAQILRGVLATIGVAAIAALGVGFYFDDHVALAAALVSLLSVPLLVWLLRAQREALAALGTALLLLAVAVVVVSQGDGLLDVGMLIFPGVIVIGSVLLEQRYATLMSVAAVLSAAAIGVAQAQGLVGAGHGLHATPRDALNATLLLTAVAIFVRILSNALYRGLHRAYLTEQTRIEIFNAVAEGIAIFDATSGKLLDINDTARHMLGVAGHTKSIDLGVFAPAEIAQDSRNLQVLQQVPADSERIISWTRPLASGRELQADVALKRVTLGGQVCIIAVARDVTEQSALREQVRQSEQLRAVGQLAGGIAHDFNNQLTGIIASASILELELQDPKLLGHVQMIQRCGTRSADLTRELLAFSRRGKTPHRHVDCHSLIAEVVALLSRSIDKRIVIEQRLGALPPYTMGDSSLLENALLNLALNACDAMPKGGNLGFHSKTVQVPSGLRSGSIPASLGPGDYIQLSVSDTGMGIEPEVLERIFEPFFTTKTKGHGMGLSAVYGTLHSHGGLVTVDSTVGAGTTFHLFLPRVAAPAEADRDSVVTELARVGAELLGVRVLLADDESDVAQVICGVLEQRGATVVACRDGRSALQEFQQSAGAFDLVILDQMMPELSGAQVLTSIRAHGSRVPVLITSGFTGDEAQLSFAAADGFLRKPFSADDLQKAVRKLLRKQLRLASSQA